MSEKGFKRAGGSPRGWIANVSPYLWTAVAISLGWQIVREPLKQRAPVAIAVRVAPTSPLALRRAAESELAAGRIDNAAALARDALARSPFNVQSLRVVGLTEASKGRTASADGILTLAGNWSLRDDPSHAWLVDSRLRRGDYMSAFAHADTLVRRREEAQPTVFRLFTTAASQDTRRALPAISRLLAAKPSWRSSYLTSLYRTPEGFQVAVNLAVALERGPAPMTTEELQELYLHLMEAGQVEVIKLVRSTLKRPAVTHVANGNFEDPAVPEPFQWQLAQKAGAVATEAADDLGRYRTSLRVEYDGYSPAIFARQRMFLEPGSYHLNAASRIESGSPYGRMVWAVTCAGEDRPRLTLPAVAPASRSQTSWTVQRGDFSIPSGCSNQWLELRGQPLDSRSQMAVWFDAVSVARVSP